MRQDTETELSTMLRQYDEKLAADARAAEQKKIEERKIHSDLERIRVNEIIPAMEEIGLALRKGGHDFKIIDKATSDSRFHKAIAGMIVFPKGLKPANAEKSYGSRVLVSLHEDEIEFGYEVEDGKGLKSSGSGGRFKINQVTREVVEQQIVSALKRGVFRLA
jgi:hypothetical protein